MNVIAPDPHVHVGAFAFNRIVPAVGDDIPVDIGIAVGAALEAEIAGAAEAVVEAVVLGRTNLVVADDVTAGRVEQRDSLRAVGVARFPVV